MGGGGERVGDKDFRSDSSSYRSLSLCEAHSAAFDSISLSLSDLPCHFQTHNLFGLLSIKTISCIFSSFCPALSTPRATPPLSHNAPKKTRRAGCDREPLPQELGRLHGAATAGGLLLPHPELRRALADFFLSIGGILLRLLLVVRRAQGPRVGDEGASLRGRQERRVAGARALPRPRGARPEPPRAAGGERGESGGGGSSRGSGAGC